MVYMVYLPTYLYREEMLQSVIRSVTRNILSILLTASLAVILIYLHVYSILIYVFCGDYFLMETHPKAMIRARTVYVKKKLTFRFCTMHVLRSIVC